MPTTETISPDSARFSAGVAAVKCRDDLLSVRDFPAFSNEALAYLMSRLATHGISTITPQHTAALFAFWVYGPGQGSYDIKIDQEIAEAAAATGMLESLLDEQVEKAVKAIQRQRSIQ